MKARLHQSASQGASTHNAAAHGTRKIVMPGNAATSSSIVVVQDAREPRRNIDSWNGSCCV